MADMECAHGNPSSCIDLNYRTIMCPDCGKMVCAGCGGLREGRAENERRREGDPGDEEMNKVFLEALQDATAADRSGAGRYDFDQAAFQRGAKWAFDWARKPQDSTTCSVGHPRACLGDRIEDTLGGQRKHYFDICFACESEAKAVDAIFAEVLSIRSDNAQFGLPKWVKDEIQRLLGGREGK